MAAIGRSSRGKRGPSSSSSSSSCLTAGIFVAFCVIGLWMLTSSSLGTSSTTTHFAASRSRGRKEVAVEEEEEAGAASRISSVVSSATKDPGDGEASWASNNEESRETGQGERRQQPMEEAGERNEETQQQQQQEKGESVIKPQQAEEEEAHERAQSEHDEQQLPGDEGVEAQQQQQVESGGEENLPQGKAAIDETHDRAQPEIEEVTDERRAQSEENAAEGNNENRQQFEENPGETQEGAHGAETQPDDKTGEAQLEERPDEGANGGQMQVEEKTGEGDGESQSGTQLEERSTEERADGDRPQFEERTEEGTEGSQPQLEDKTGEGANGDQMQSEDHVDGNENQQQSEKEMDSEGGGDGRQQPAEQQVEEENPTGTGEAGQQQGEEKLSDPNAADSLPEGARPEVSNEGSSRKTPWETQADHSENEKERRRGEELRSSVYDWKLCNVTAGPDYIPCLDNTKAIKKLHSLRHYEHRERHCPEESPTCLVPPPKGYRRSVEWPNSRERIWYSNVPHTKLAEVKGHQNWVKVTGEYLTFPGGGTQFIHGALHYIDFLQKSLRNIAWGKRTRVIIDVGCGVASFGGYLFERDVLAMSLAPKDEHEAQVQMALERGIPAISAVMGSQRLPFPSRVFDLVHCARCRVPWHVEGGTLLLELNRVLRPGGYFVWSATPVYQKLKEDVEIWKEMTLLTRSMCWSLVTIQKDKLNGVGAAIYQKPTSNECYDNRKHHSPPMCEQNDDPNAAWYIPLKTCMHRVPVDASERGSQWPEHWPRRLAQPPYWLNGSQMGVYGKPAPADFKSDYEHWKRVVTKSYLSGLGISWSKVRNVMDMRAVYGGFAAALKDLKVWVLNVVNIDSLDTLPIIYERGLFGIYHDWCESFSTYPRSYDLLHADHLFSNIKQRCTLEPVIAEVDRIVRPGGKLIIRDESAMVNEVENLLKSLHWEIRLTFTREREGILCAEKSDWRPDVFEDSS